MTFTDPRDGKVYKTVEIGGQIWTSDAWQKKSDTWRKAHRLVWMAENLAYECEGSRCYKDNPANGEKYGRLYDWETAKKACPPGWHLPSKEEWQTLVDFAGGNKIAGKHLKTKNGWSVGNGTDDLGFSALPGGLHFCRGTLFGGVGSRGCWWSSSGYSYDGAYFMHIWHDVCTGECIEATSNLFSVRCVQDFVVLYDWRLGKRIPVRIPTIKFVPEEFKTLEFCIEAIKNGCLLEDVPKALREEVKIKAREAI